LFGSDGKMGGKAGIIDNKVTRAFTKRDEENLAAGLVKKQAGGMMKKKRYARGGAVGMAGPKGGLQPAVTQQRGTASGQTANQRMDLLKAARSSMGRSGPREEKLAAAKKAMAMRGAAGRRSGGSTPRGMNMGGSAMKSKMASKGGKMGGMMPPGYKNGGSVSRKKTARGVGAAKRGFGKAMR